jgi:hypothetical protein
MLQSLNTVTVWFFGVKLFCNQRLRILKLRFLFLPTEVFAGFFTMLAVVSSWNIRVELYGE